MKALHLTRQLRNYLWTEFIYGSSVSTQERMELKKSYVRNIVEQGSKSKLLKKPTKPILQAYGQLIVLKAIEKWAKRKSPVTTDDLLKIHQLFLGSVDPSAGTFRGNHIMLRSSALMPSFPFAISADIRDFNIELIGEQKRIKKGDRIAVIALAAKVYHRITMIHPFSDGNGRSSRLFMNLLLRKYGLPYVLIPKVDNVKEVREVLRVADMGDIEPWVKYLKELLDKSEKMIQDPTLRSHPKGL